MALLLLFGLFIFRIVYFFKVGFALFVFILHGRGCLVHSLKVDKQAKLDFIHLLADNFSKDYQDYLFVCCRVFFFDFFLLGVG